MADRRLRSYLYAPGDRERLVHSALRSAADAVVLDLEDAVAPRHKDLARETVAGVLGLRRGEGPQRHVRINRDGGAYSLPDLAAVTVPGLDAIRLPKCERPDAVQAVDAELSALEAQRGLEQGSISIYPIIESAVGVIHAAAVATASPRVVALAFGATDLLADLGAAGPPDGDATFHARAHLVLLSRVAGVAGPIDSVHTDLEDLEGLRRSAEQARRLGFSGKSVIHPNQLDAVHDAFRPTSEEVDAARQVVSAAQHAASEGSGTTVLGGQFIDAAVVARAHGVLDEDGHLANGARDEP